MVFTKSINVFTLVIIIITFNVENSNGNACLVQISRYGQMDINFSGAEAFEYVYLYLNVSTKYLKARAILRRYVENIYETATSNFDFGELKSPLVWCEEQIIKNQINYTGNIKEFCSEDINLRHFKDLDNAEIAFHYSFFNLTNKSIPSRRMNINPRIQKGYALNYFMYMHATIMPHVVETSVQGPRKYCENYKYLDLPLTYTYFNDKIIPTSSKKYIADCLDQIKFYGNMDSNLNTTDAFKSVYENLIIHNTRGKKKEILHNYINYLYGAATLNFDFNLLLKPLDWCKEYIGQLVPVLEYSTLERNCDDHLGRVYFRFNVSSEEAFQHAYFNIVKKNVLDDVYYVARMYYEYLLDAFLPYIDPVAKGPSEYCDPNNPRNVALTNTSFDSQVIPIATTHYFMDQSQIAEFSGSQNLYQYQNPENGPKLSLEFTSGISEINTARKNHLDIDLNQSVYYDTQEGNEYIYQDYNRPSGSTSAAIERNTITNNLVDIDLNLLSAMSLEQFSNTYNDDVPFQPHSNTFKPSKSREIDLNTVPEDYMNIDYSNNE